MRSLFVPPRQNGPKMVDGDNMIDVYRGPSLLRYSTQGEGVRILPGVHINS